MASSKVVGNVPAIVASCRKAYAGKAMLPIEKRKAVIRRIASAIKSNESSLLAATQADLGKSAFESKVTELSMILHEAYTILDHLDQWTAPEAVTLEGIQKLDTTYIKRDPLGVVLIIGAWNYPLQLTLMPLLGALAGGNTVVVKPSEVSPASSKMVAQLLGEAVDPSIVAVVEGGIPETTALLKEKFDHILYTGNGRVGRIVATAAAQHLTPVTLELGGKSPVVIDRSANLRITARRIMWGRFVNAGQTCIAPDYLLVQADVKPRLLEQLRIARDEFLGSDPKASKDYGRIVNDMHYERIKKLMTNGTVVLGGECDASSKFIAPTVLDNVDLNSPLMTDEIFGPLLPLVEYESTADACEFINRRDKPLALYVFSSNKKVVDYILQNTTAGGVTVNDTLMHTSISGLPFGGVGESGCGGYHGKHSFDTFTHRKGVLAKPLALEAVNSLRYPPYTDRKYSLLMSAIGKMGERSNTARNLCYVAAVVCVAYLAHANQDQLATITNRML